MSCHNAIRDLFSAAQSAALAPLREMPYLIPNSLSRPADILLPTWSWGHPAPLDIHVISPLQQQIMGESASIPDHALQVGVHCKLTSHLSACRSAGEGYFSEIWPPSLQLMHKAAVSLVYHKKVNLRIHIAVCQWRSQAVTNGRALNHGC